GHVRALVDAGCRAALSQRGVAHISCPVDLQEQTIADDERSQKKVEGHTSNAWRPPIVIPRVEDLRAAADVLNAGTRTVIRGVQIVRAASRIGLRFAVEVGLCGDAKATLQALLPHIQRRRDRAFLEEAQAGMKAWRELMRTRAHEDSVPLKPQVVAGALNALLADDAIISTDSGTITTWVARHINMRRNQLFSCSGNLATMAPGLPYAIAAQ